MEMIEHPTMKGFFLVPGFKHTYIEKHGIMYDDKAKDYLQIKMAALYPYPCVRPSERPTDVLIHRSLALTFLECPGNPDDYQVDHLNMDKLDWRLTNLEWVTKSENMKRAGKTLWRRPLEVKDLVTGKIVGFGSIRECARFFGTHPGEIVYFLQNNKLAPYQQKYDIIFAGHSWSALTASDVGKTRRGVDREVVVVDMTGKGTVHIYARVTLAAKAIGLKRGALTRWLSGKTKLQLVKGIRVEYLSDFVGHLGSAIRVSKEKTLFANQHKHKTGAVIVKDVRTDETKTWTSLQAFADSLGVLKGSIMKSMIRNSGVYRFYKIVYEDVPSA
mgnify:CR=1 FL=1